MSELFASGRIVDVILVLLVLEVVLLMALRRRRGAQFMPADVLWTLLSGACLLLALRAVIVEAWWGWTALFLTLALLAHLGDLWRRLRR